MHKVTQAVWSKAGYRSQISCVPAQCSNHKIILPFLQQMLRVPASLPGSASLPWRPVENTPSCATAVCWYLRHRSISVLAWVLCVCLSSNRRHPPRGEQPLPQPSPCTVALTPCLMLRGENSRVIMRHNQIEKPRSIMPSGYLPREAGPALPGSKGADALHGETSLSHSQPSEES